MTVYVDETDRRLCRCVDLADQHSCRPATERRSELAALRADAVIARKLRAIYEAARAKHRGGGVTLEHAWEHVLREIEAGR